MTFSQVITLLLALAAGVFAGYIARRKFIESRQENIEEQGKKLIENALDEADKIKKEALLHAKDEEYQLKKSAELEIKEIKAGILSEEKRLTQKSEQIDRKIDLLDKKELDLLGREKSISSEEKKVEDKRNEINSIIEDQRRQLEKISGISNV